MFQNLITLYTSELWLVDGVCETRTRTCVFGSLLQARLRPRAPRPARLACTAAAALGSFSFVGRHALATRSSSFLRSLARPAWHPCCRWPPRRVGSIASRSRRGPAGNGERLRVREWQGRATPRGALTGGATRRGRPRHGVWRRWLSDRGVDPPYLLASGPLVPDHTGARGTRGRPVAPRTRPGRCRPRAPRAARRAARRAPAWRTREEAAPFAIDDRAS